METQLPSRALGQLRALPDLEQKAVLPLVCNAAGVVSTTALKLRAKARAALMQGVAEKLITNEGGIFLGEGRLKALGVIKQDATIPPLSEKFSKTFLHATHPLRGGKMEEHIILGFDPRSEAWLL